MGVSSGVSVVVPAAGRGERLGVGVPKALVPLHGVPMVLHTLRRLGAAALFDEAVVAAPASHVEAVERLTAGAADWPFAVRVVRGGSERQESVRFALEHIGRACRIVVVHDAARPCVPVEVVQRCVAAAREGGAALAAVPIQDTLKRVHQGHVIATVVRAGLWVAQTPQAFDAALLRAAHLRAVETGYVGTDDAALIEWAGVAPRIVEGDLCNIKITTAADLRHAETLLQQR